MYIPATFAESDTATLHDLIEAHPFGLLASTPDAALVGSHLPFVLDRDRGPYGTLLAHVARDNPQWRGFDGTAEALAIFAGPHAYVSPRWYAPGKAVPTWNYAVVHAYGAPALVDDPAAVRRQQEILVAAFEGPEGWSMKSQPADYIAAMLEGIVAFEIPIACLDGKFKLSQNRPVEDRRRVAEALAGSPREAERGVAALMREREG